MRPTKTKLRPNKGRVELPIASLIVLGSKLNLVILKSLCIAKCVANLKGLTHAYAERILMGNVANINICTARSFFESSATQCNKKQRKYHYK